jgi:hypothetical protein
LDGLQSLAWFKAGELDKTIKDCTADVELTRRPSEFGQRHGCPVHRHYQGWAIRPLVRFGENDSLPGGGIGYNATAQGG